MAGPTVTVSPTSGPAGTVVTVTTVRDVPAQPIVTTATTTNGTGSATFSLVESFLNGTPSNAPARALTLVSDNGTTLVQTYVA